MNGHVNSLLAGKTAFITGGAQGIGLAVAEAFLQQGAKVIAADIDQRMIDAARLRLDSLAPGRASVVSLDVTDQDATERCADALFSEGGVDIVVPNAGILALKHAIDMDLATWRRVLDVNLTGAFLTATSFARRMVANHRPGRIIFTASLFGVRGGRENSAYSASKFGMIGLMQSLAAELAEKGILVNSVCPGQIDTQMIRALFSERAALRGTSAESLQRDFEAKIPIGKLGPLEELAGAYVYLASDLARYVVGQSHVVDGGWQVG
ncbi:NAD(P)-dependent dehydrogenase (short-subunit alcohol dehydrogenase family) [Mycoplana sp. BE70]|uniref:SDR family NAD(P)-dependent oxidoreductase n=1 Tax=Mycoplana sp. BE70 TaxID=2817775 RepID=UPI002862F219|nr:SDR family NAD(P)-dependent oxidoreductase [Mycoplana sp. BE70]MDR6755136.1 NAD(P)-dependent dehydrogenase (short-subunit alcohol dehydrogenase family) [Mycoplana sp. BE70]